MLTNYINSFAIALSLSTATGIFVHDTKIDKAVTALSLPPIVATTAAVATAHAMLSGTPHTHSERMSFAQAVHDLKSQNPRIQPRSNDKKHLLQKRVAKGHHPFDNYNLPIV